MKARRAIRVSLVTSLCVLLGTATTVGVAWAASLWADGSIATAQIEGADIQEWPVAVPDDWSPPKVASRNNHRFLTMWLIGGLRPEEQGLPIACTVLRHQAGWPWRSLESVRVVETRHRSDYKKEFDPGFLRAGIPDVGPQDKMNGRTGVLPISPLLPGFAFDSFLYAAAWYVMLFTPLPLYRAGRRRFRVSRGMCGTCGYDLRGSPGGACPECGKAAAKVKSQVVTRPGRILVRCDRNQRSAS